MKNLVFLFVAALLLISCEKDEKSVDSFAEQDLVIYTGYVCGWGAGQDSLVISSDQFSYVFEASFPEDKELKKHGDVNASDWEQLVAKLDFNTFSAVDINTCYVCVDGCDYWVTVRKGNQTHTIRYGQNDEDLATIEPIADFIAELESLKGKLLAD